MRITFLLPGSGREPIGGFKVVYEYANGLAARGHRVTVLHAARIRTDDPFPVRVRRAAAHALGKFRGDYGPADWFDLDPRVVVSWIPSLDPRRVPDADAVVATAWQTAEWAAGYPAAKGRKFYLVQHRETWGGPEARVMATWKLPLRKIVIARWLEAIASSLGERSAYIPNGLDFDAFGMDVPPEARPPASFLMLHHAFAWKGSGDGLRALETVLERRPDATVSLFGTGAPPPGLPPAITYHRNPPQAGLRALYNRAAIFVAPSLTEGWPLPPAEAMMSGCALVATDIGGHREYAIPEETALLSPPGDPPALAASLLRLADDPGLRVRLARAGRAHIERFTWTRAVDAFERVLHE